MEWSGGEVELNEGEWSGMDELECNELKEKSSLNSLRVAHPAQASLQAKETRYRQTSECQLYSGVMADSLRRVSTVSVLNQAVIAWILPFGLCLKILFHLFETGTFCLVKTNTSLQCDCHALTHLCCFIKNLACQHCKQTMQKCTCAWFRRHKAWLDSFQSINCTKHMIRMVFHTFKNVKFLNINLRFSVMCCTVCVLMRVVSISQHMVSQQLSMV